MNISKILIANRGEIAVRIIKTCKKMGINTVAVYSQIDRKTPHVKLADEAVCIGESPASESYLDHNKIIAAAHKTKSDAIHPGYGFVAENSEFAELCSQEKINFIGPLAQTIKKMGQKILAKKFAIASGVPVIPGYQGQDQSLKVLKREALKIGFPILIKASSGGGGKGMQIVRKEQELEAAIESAKRAAEKAFGDNTVFLEKYFDSVKHIEIQILGDQHGHIIHCGERECSIQRRYQKIIEEAPSLAIDDHLRMRMGQAAVQMAKEVNYIGAGTVEFVLETTTKEFYFLEMNTRLQVEHPVTEAVTGIDLVEQQILIAAGKTLGFTQEEIKIKGHAIECRLYAENPVQDFLPCTGKVEFFSPAANVARFDTGIESDQQISIFYDPMIAKVITYAENREQCLIKMRKTLQDTILLGVTTNYSFLRTLMDNPKFCQGEFDTRFIEKNKGVLFSQENQKDFTEIVIAACIWSWLKRYKQQKTWTFIRSGWRNNFYAPQQEIYVIAKQEFDMRYKVEKDQSFSISVNNQEFISVVLIEDNAHSVCCEIADISKNFTFIAAALLDSPECTNQTIFAHEASLGVVTLERQARFARKEKEHEQGEYIAPMPGKILKVLVKAGDKVEEGQSLMIMESMKMESTICAFAPGVVKEIFVAIDEMVEANTKLLHIEEEKI